MCIHTIYSITHFQHPQTKSQPFQTRQDNLSSLVQEWTSRNMRVNVAEVERGVRQVGVRQSNEHGA
jgi:hypothetical protein